MTVKLQRKARPIAAKRHDVPCFSFKFYHLPTKNDSFGDCRPLQFINYSIKRIIHYLSSLAIKSPVFRLCQQQGGRLARLIRNYRARHFQAAKNRLKILNFNNSTEEESR